MTLRDIKDSIEDTFTNIANWLQYDVTAWFFSAFDNLANGNILDLTIGQVIFLVVLLYPVAKLIFIYGAALVLGTFELIKHITK